MKSIEEYIEQLCREHKQIQHEVDGKCHYSCTADDNELKQSRKMRYPCIVLDVGEVYFPSDTMAETASILVLDHVKDAGNTKEVQAVFARTKRIMLDFIRRMNRDKRKGTEPLMARFQRNEVEGRRIYLDSASLYGYYFSFSYATGFTDEDCSNAFNL